MTPITIDFETYWSTDFSLSKINFMEYIMSPEFEVISVAVKIGTAETEVVLGDKVEAYLKGIDWTNAACVAHNGNEFDFPLLVWRYDVHPKLFVDTLALSKARHQSEVGGSLAKLSKHYNLSEKDNTILLNTKGRRLADFDLREIVAMLNYNKGDSDNAYALFREFRTADTEGVDDLRDIARATAWHKTELALCDMTARMIVYPQFVCDIDLLDRTLAEAEDIKDKQLESLLPVLGLLDTDEVRKAMGSANQFAAALEAVGVAPPLKISKTTGKPAYAFAKTDPEMQALMEHDDETVQLLASVRLGVKSTLLETRLAKMSSCAKVMGGSMPVPLAYHSATTGRWGGRVWNPQNLPRINPKKSKLTDALRKSLRAPEGYKIVVSDLSGIELRVNHYLWDVDSTRELYESDPEADLYKEFAAALFGIPKEQVTKDQRQLAKVAQLGLGFGAGWSTFQKVAKLMGGITLDAEEAQRVTSTWRTKYSAITYGWKSCQKLIDAMYTGAEYSPDPRGLVKAGRAKVRLPSGRVLYYPNLRIEVGDTGKLQYVYGEGRNRSKVYSGLMDENLVQAIARDVISEQALTVFKRTGLSPALMVHDELVYVVPEHKSQSHLDILNEVMRTPPSWLPGIVLWSEGDIADTYGDAK
jgi:hypothetical protein